MKNIVDMKLSKFPFVIIALFLSFMLSACLKNKDGYNENVVSALSVVNASVWTPPVDFVLDGQRVNNQSFEFGDRIQYFGVYSGTWPAAFYQGNTHTNPLLKTSITLLNGKYYTLFFTGDKETPEGLLLEDDIRIPEKGEVTLRFVNLSPDAGPVDFRVGSEVLAARKDFKDYTSFQAISAGTYQAAVLAQNGAILKELELKLVDGRIYTVWLKGLAKEDSGEKDLQLDTGLIDHRREL